MSQRVVQCKFQSASPMANAQGATGTHARWGLVCDVAKWPARVGGGGRPRIDVNRGAGSGARDRPQRTTEPTAEQNVHVLESRAFRSGQGGHIERLRSPDIGMWSSPRMISGLTDRIMHQCLFQCTCSDTTGCISSDAREHLQKALPSPAFLLLWCPVRCHRRLRICQAGLAGNRCELQDTSLDAHGEEFWAMS